MQKYSLFHSVQIDSEAHPAICHSSPSSAEVKKGEAIYPLPHMSACRDAQLAKHRDNFAFYITVREKGSGEVLA
jgi:hypothetical protein